MILARPMDPLMTNALAVSGYDPGYYAAQAATAGQRQAVGGYYAKEAPGLWFGTGLDALGLAEGQVVEIELDDQGNVVETGAFFDIYSEQRHPVTGEILGRRPDRRDAAGKRVSSTDEKLAKLLQAEPHADAKRVRQLAAVAARSARPSPRYTDVTIGFSKSISVLHASIRVNQQAAEAAGDKSAAAYWGEREARFQEILQEANRAAMRHGERYAVTRTGYHGRKIDGRETGKFARTLPVVSTWLQGTNRDGDPHDHGHNLWWRMSRTADDGIWRGLDTMSLRYQLPTMAGIASAHVESALARDFGVAWIARKDGAGNEIRGVTQAQMDQFSSRRADIDDAVAERVEQFADTYGRAPSRAELTRLRDQVKTDTRQSKPEGDIDWAECARKWDAQLQGELAPLASRVSSLAPPGARERETAVVADWEPDPGQIARTARMALASVQARQSAWGRADLFREVDHALPAESRTMEKGQLTALVHDVTDRAIRGEFEGVVHLDAPEWPALPDYLRRADLDGRSVYTRPGSERFATHVQLSTESRLVEMAQRHGAPCLSREDAARALGADAAALDAALRERAQDARAAETRTGAGLRLDQGAAAYHLLTSPQVVETLVGPAGAGKTFTLASVARAWTASGRPVIGLATSQMGANALREAGIERVLNIAQFLGHSPGHRGARGVASLDSETLIVVDEASMTGTPDMADIAGIAARDGHKMIASGDHAQLSAIESGGAMSLLVSRLGHVQLAEAVRFTHEWEQQATLSLRAGNVAVLEEYRARGRLRGGSPDEIKAAARRLYVSHYLQGTDVELIVWQRDLARELADSVRSDLQHLGRVSAGGPEAELAEGSRAGAGDLIRAKTMDHSLGVANNDVFRVEEVCEDGSLTVRRMGRRDAETGQRTWADETFRYRGYRTAELAYSSTAHAKQGATVTVGLPVVTGGETAEWLYSAASRGAEENIILTYTTPARRADPRPGGQAAPELAERERVKLERAGLPLPAAEPDPDVEPRDVAAVLADVMERSGAEMSALDLQRRNRANADHLGILNAQWQGETAGLHAARYRSMIAAHMPAGVEAERLDSAQFTWLGRTLRQAEAAGLDAGAVVGRAVDGRDLQGVQDVPSVIDARIRRENGPMLPGPWRPWSAQVPQVEDPDAQRYLGELAHLMDERRERIGEDASENGRPWAVTALGPVPDEPLERLEWTGRASAIGAYRELYGWEHETEPCGPEPAGDAPEAREAWHAAHSAVTRTSGRDLSAEPDGRLLRMREQFSREYGWAPAYPAGRLETMRAAIIDRSAAAVRSDAEAEAAEIRGDQEAAERHAGLGRSARSAVEFYRQREALDAAVMADREDWERVTEGTRSLALQADAELRRRSPDVPLAPLISGEAVLPEEDGLPEKQAADELAAAVARAGEQRAQFRERLEERMGLQVPAEDPDAEPEGDAWPMRPSFDRDAILQPPMPEIRPAEAVVAAAAERDAAMEVGQ